MFLWNEVCNSFGGGKSVVILHLNFKTVGNSWESVINVFFSTGSNRGFIWRCSSSRSISIQCCRVRTDCTISARFTLPQSSSWCWTCWSCRDLQNFCTGQRSSWNVLVRTLGQWVSPFWENETKNKWKLHPRRTWWILILEMLPTLPTVLFCTGVWGFISA